MAAKILRLTRLSALVAVMGGHQAACLPAPPLSPKSRANVASGEYLTIEVPSPKASGDATAGEPTTALVPSWVLASDDPAKAPRDCTITMEIGYVRKWYVPTAHASTANHEENQLSRERFLANKAGSTSRKSPEHQSTTSACRTRTTLSRPAATAGNVAR